MEKTREILSVATRLVHQLGPSMRTSVKESLNRAILSTRDQQRLADMLDRSEITWQRQLTFMTHKFPGVAKNLLVFFLKDVGIGIDGR
jgi:hypothetical protein